MMPRTTLLVAVLALGGCTPRPASPEALWSDAQARLFFNDKGCNACHATDELRIGPAYRSVAQLYADRSEDAVARLSLKIRHGGAGAWGAVPMVSNPTLTDAEARSVARWVLSLPTGRPASLRPPEAAAQ